MFKDPIYVTQPFLPPFEEFSHYLKDIWESKWVTNNGEFHQKLESELTKFLGVEHISLFTNGTIALVTALQALNITGEVITTPFSFVASSHALKWNGITPVFSDIDPTNFNLDPAKIRNKITSRTRAILPVHVYGNPCDVYTISKIAEEYNLKVIYDACHTFGVKIGGQSVLNFGDLSVLSFHGTKVYNTFEGGAIVSHTAEMKRRIDLLKNFGFLGETEVVEHGINGKMNEFQAALGLLQLKYVNQAIASRRELTYNYREQLRNIKGIKVLEDFTDVEHCYSYFPVLINRENYPLSRDEVYSKLKEFNIFTRRYFYPLISKFPAYKNLDSSKPGLLPVAERISNDILCLPLYPDLDKEVVNFVCDFLKSNSGY